MENLMIYPFDIESSPLIRHRNLIKDYKVKSLIAPNGWGTNKKDAGIVDNASEIDCNISCDFEKQIEFVDTVFFADSALKLDFKTCIYPKILKAVECGKNIISDLDLSHDCSKYIKDICALNKVRFEDIADRHNDNKFSDSTDDLIYEIDTPVVFVCGNDERTDKFEIQLSLREKLLRDGYKVSQIGSKKYSELFGFYSFPDYFYSTSFLEAEKIVMFNHFVKNIEIADNPDIIIIGVPLGLISFDNEFHNNFGITAFEVANALTPDYTICSQTYREYTVQDLNEAGMGMKYKFGFEPDCFNLSNTRIDWNASKEFCKKLYTKINLDLVDKKVFNLKKSGCPIVNIFNDKDAELLYKNMIDSLADNGVVTWM